jgi:hypothetical protein
MARAVVAESSKKESVQVFLQMKEKPRIVELGQDE